MKYAPYPYYKASGIEWLGDVPEGWSVGRVQHNTNMKFSNVDKLTVEGEVSVLLCNYVNVYKNDYINSQLDFMQASATLAEIQDFRLQLGDVIITKDSESPDDIAIPAYVIETVPNLICGYHLAVLRARPKKCEGKYLFYFFMSKLCRQQFENQANGITRFGLSQRAIAKGWFIVPSLPEQHAIATFLDQETANIDALIAKQEQMIALLREKRQAVISHAVTKGLDPTAPMKPSGVEWLGDVPEAWEVQRISYLFSKIGSGTTPPSDELQWYDGEIPWVTTGELRESVITQTEKSISYEAKKKYSSLNLYPKDSIVIAMYGATIGRVAILGIEATTNQACCVFSKSLKVSTYFAFMFFVGFRDNIVQLADGGGQPNINQEKLRNLRFPTPPLPEQHAIATFLDQETAKIDALIAKQEQMITLLGEHRAALITAAVTGKIDVRQAVPSTTATTEGALTNAR